MTAFLNNPTDAEPSRDPLDRCYTPRWAVRLLLEKWPIGPEQAIWEPCAGHGHIVKPLQATGAYVHGSDIDPSSPYEHRDFLETDQRPSEIERALSAIWTNPPYRIKRGVDWLTAADFVRHALGFTPNVAMLLRVNWLEPCKERETIFMHRPPSRLYVLPRVHYEGAGGGDTNSHTSIWFVWNEGIQDGCKVEWWTEADKHRAQGQQSLFSKEAS